MTEAIVAATDRFATMEARVTRSGLCPQGWMVTYVPSHGLLGAPSASRYRFRKAFMCRYDTRVSGGGSMPLCGGTRVERPHDVDRGQLETTVKAGSVEDSKPVITQA